MLDARARPLVARARGVRIAPTICVARRTRSAAACAPLTRTPPGEGIARQRERTAVALRWAARRVAGDAPGMAIDGSCAPDGLGVAAGRGAGARGFGEALAASGPTVVVATAAVRVGVGVD